MDSAIVRERIKIDGLEVVRLYPADEALADYPREKLNRNIEAYDQDGKLAWTIEECPAGGADADKAYMSIELKDGLLIAGNWVGLDFVVNTKDGSISPANKGVRPW